MSNKNVAQDLQIFIQTEEGEMVNITAEYEEESKQEDFTPCEDCDCELSGDISLSEENFIKIMELFDNPPAPNEALVEAARKYTGRLLNPWPIKTTEEVLKQEVEEGLKELMAAENKIDEAIVKYVHWESIHRLTISFITRTVL